MNSLPKIVFILSFKLSNHEIIRFMFAYIIKIDIFVFLFMAMWPSG